MQLTGRSYLLLLQVLKRKKEVVFFSFFVEGLRGEAKYAVERCDGDKKKSHLERG